MWIKSSGVQITSSVPSSNVEAGLVMCWLISCLLQAHARSLKAQSCQRSEYKLHFIPAYHDTYCFTFTYVSLHFTCTLNIFSLPCNATNLMPYNLHLLHTLLTRENDHNWAHLFNRRRQGTVNDVIETTKSQTNIYELHRNKRQLFSKVYPIQINYEQLPVQITIEREAVLSSKLTRLQSRHPATRYETEHNDYMTHPKTIHYGCITVTDTKHDLMNTNIYCQAFGQTQYFKLLVCVCWCFPLRLKSPTFLQRDGITKCVLFLLMMLSNTNDVSRW